MIKDRKFYKTYFGLMGSIALQNLLAYSVSFADNLMLGGYSETALSAATLCNMIQFILQQVVFGIAEGVVVMGAQYWGKKNTEPIVHIVGIALRFGLIISALMFAAVCAFPRTVMGLLTNDPGVITDGVAYLRIICFSYIVFMITNVLIQSMRSIGKVRIGYIISASSLVINVCLNYCLIYGNLGCPELGIKGAAIATLISQCMGLVIISVYLKFFEHTLNITVKKLIHADMSYLKSFRKVASPSIINGTQWGFAHCVQSAVIGHLGSTAIAANSIATILFQVTTVVIYGNASATSIITGKTIGEGNRQKLKSLVKTVMILSACLGAIVSGVIWLARVPLLTLYKITPEAHDMALQFIAVMAFVTLGTAIQLPMDVGIIRGGGDTAFGAKMNIISMWFIILPASLLTAFVFKCPPLIVFMVIKSEQVYKNIPVLIHLFRWKWARDVTQKA